MNSCSVHLNVKQASCSLSVLFVCCPYCPLLVNIPLFPTEMAFSDERCTSSGMHTQTHTHTVTEFYVKQRDIRAVTQTQISCCDHHLFQKCCDVFFIYIVFCSRPVASFLLKTSAFVLPNNQAVFHRLAPQLGQSNVFEFLPSLWCVPPLIALCCH